MLIQKIDAIGAEPAERGFGCFVNVFGAAIGPSDLPVFNAKAEFGRDNRLVPAALQRSPEQFLINKGAIHFGGIEEVEPEVESAMDGGDRLLFVSGPVGLAHAHAAESKRGDLEPLRPEFSYR